MAKSAIITNVLIHISTWTTLLLIHSASDAAVPSKYANRSDDWLRSDEGREIAQNVLSWQSSPGSWPKNRDTASQPYRDDQAKLNGTFDNGATTDELRFLARVCKATDEQRFKDAFFKGLDHVLEAQYPTGGWPQHYPPGRGYHRYITFNDNTTVRILQLLRSVAESSDYVFVGQDRRLTAKAAFDKGIRCILECQIVVGGKRTVWCAQHDEVDLRPRAARAYELESLSGAESAAILKLLMSLENPSHEVRRAIRDGAAWYESVKIMGIRVERKDNARVVFEDPAAPPLWARFYEIETNRPFFCGRDGVKRYQLSKIDAERRSGYAWYGQWGRDVEESYTAWRKRWPDTEEAR
jgi:PelA/Pel-15E family pectate lyase